MLTRNTGSTVACLCLLALPVAALAQPEPVAVVTAQSGGGARRGGTDEAFPVAAGMFSLDDNGLAPGDSVITAADGTAVVLLPEFGVVIRLGPASELSVEALSSLEGHVNVAPVLRRGSALLLQRHSDERWLAIGGESDPAAAYALVRGGSVAVSAEAGRVSFSAGGGEVICYRGALPATPLLDATGAPADQTGTVLPAGQSVSSEDLRRIAPDNGAAAATEAMAVGLFDFGLSSGTFWIQRAEQGDFTPVRASERGAFEVVRGQLTAGMAFDQPRSALVTPAPRILSQPIRTVPTAPSLTQALLESGIPTSVVVGQRIRRTRIIGNPGTTSGQIRFNPNAEQLIRLPRR